MSNTVMTSCPFRGATTDLPHESQEACIAALHQEIACTRKFVERVKPVAAPPPANDQKTTGDPKSDE